VNVKSPTGLAPDGDGETEALGDMLWLGDLDAEGDFEADAEGDALADGLLLGEADFDALADGLLLADGDLLADGEMEADGDVDGLADGETDREFELDGLTELDGLALIEDDGETDGLAEDFGFFPTCCTRVPCGTTITPAPPHLTTPRASLSRAPSCDPTQAQNPTRSSRPYTADYETAPS
jgi:hypothetical protein